MLGRRAALCAVRAVGRAAARPTTGHGEGGASVRAERRLEPTPLLVKLCQHLPRVGLVDGEALRTRNGFG